MELRRALLLFAIVLGLAAVVASVARPPTTDDPPPAQREDRERGALPPTAGDGPGSAPGSRAKEPIRIRFGPAGPIRTKSVLAGRAGTVTVAVDEPGQVELGGLGLLAFAEPTVPARFEVLSAIPGFHAVRFTPGGGDEPRTLGVLRLGL